MQFLKNNKNYIIIGVLLALIIFFIVKKKEIKQATNNVINYLILKTWDTISDARIETLHPLIRSDVKQFIIRAEKELNIKLRVTQANRSWEEQDKLYQQGRTSPGKIVTNAPAGSSYHNYALAFDVVEIKDGKAIWNNPRWNEIATLAKQIGFEWGGDWQSFKDKPHFQKTFNYSIAQLKDNYLNNQLTPDGFINLA